MRQAQGKIRIKKTPWEIHGDKEIGCWLSKTRHTKVPDTRVRAAAVVCVNFLLHVFKNHIA